MRELYALRSGVQEECYKGEGKLKMKDITIPKKAICIVVFLINLKLGKSMKVTNQPVVCHSEQWKQINQLA